MQPLTLQRLFVRLAALAGVLFIVVVLALKLAGATVKATNVPDVLKPSPLPEMPTPVKALPAKGLPLAFSVSPLRR